MKNGFDLLLNEYLIDNSLLVDSNKNYYLEFVKNTPEFLYKYFDKDKFLIKASIGAGQKSEIPWLCIFNRSVTTSATQGIYICYLFRKDMSGFYLVLGQGITTFLELYGNDKYNNIKKVAEYFRNLIHDNRFSKDEIDLRGTKVLAKGYEAGTIISKYYDKDNYSDKDLITDLLNLKEIYDDICESMIEIPYMKIVDNVVNNLESSSVEAHVASKILNDKLKEENSDVSTTLELASIPKFKKKAKYNEITKNTIKKVDYIKKAKTNFKNGLLGEKLVIDYEKERLTQLGREDLVEKIKWISRDDDNKGYDIISFDIGENNKVEQKYIEVKTTSENDTTDFYISSNELDAMGKLKKQYFIYRVYNVNSDNPKLFILEYKNFKKMIKLEIENYIAKIKEEV